MDSQRQDTVDTILELAQSIEPRLKTMSLEDRMTEVSKTYRIDLIEDDEDKLERLTEELARKKKSMPSRAMAAVAPVKGIPKAIASDALALTDFQYGERIRHMNCPDWGEGDIVSVETYNLGKETLQKLQILFNMVGRKFLVVRPGMLERVGQVAAKAPTAT